MKPSNEDHTTLTGLLEKLKQELTSGYDEIQHELSDLLAGADRDLIKLKDSTPQDSKELKSLSDQLQTVVADFKTEHPRLSRIAQELVDHFNHMGI